MKKLIGLMGVYGICGALATTGVNGAERGEIVSISSSKGYAPHDIGMNYARREGGGTVGTKRWVNCRISKGSGDPVTVYVSTKCVSRLTIGKKTPYSIVKVGGSYYMVASSVEKRALLMYSKKIKTGGTGGNPHRKGL